MAAAIATINKLELILTQMRSRCKSDTSTKERSESAKYRF